MTWQWSPEVRAHLIITDWATGSGYVLDTWGGLHRAEPSPEVTEQADDPTTEGPSDVH